jgi:hypothetical protein
MPQTSQPGDPRECRSVSNSDNSGTHNGVVKNRKPPPSGAVAELMRAEFDAKEFGVVGEFATPSAEPALPPPRPPVLQPSGPARRRHRRSLDLERLLGRGLLRRRR